MEHHRGPVSLGRHNFGVITITRPADTDIEGTLPGTRPLRVGEPAPKSGPQPPSERQPRLRWHRDHIGVIGCRRLNPASPLRRSRRWGRCSRAASPDGYERPAIGGAERHRGVRPPAQDERRRHLGGGSRRSKSSARPMPSPGQPIRRHSAPADQRRVRGGAVAAGGRRQVFEFPHLYQPRVPGDCTDALRPTRAAAEVLLRQDRGCCLSPQLHQSKRASQTTQRAFGSRSVIEGNERLTNRLR